MNRMLHRRIPQAAMLTVALVLLAVSATGIAFAETPSDATKITLSVSKTARLGQNVQLTAQLKDASGAPISGAKIAFVVPDTFFLGATSDVLIGEVQTNKEGVAETEYQGRNTGWLAFRADFRGNERNAASRATGRILIDELPRQLYTAHAGVQVPGLNAPPNSRVLNEEHGEEIELGEALTPPSGVATLWPMLSAWPIVLVLLIVWSMYAIAVRQMFRIASARDGDLPSVRTRRVRGL